MKRKEIFIVLIILSLINFGVSGYHFGIEQGFFEETSSCKIENTGNIDKNQLLREMEKKNVVSCKDINFTILGLSLASINLIISLLLSLVYFKIYLWTKKIS
jgi:disulfide bond formation protein DsbB